MINEENKRILKTINVTLSLWERLMVIKIKKNYASIPQVIEDIIEKNKKLRQQMIELKNKKVVA